MKRILLASAALAIMAAVGAVAFQQPQQQFFPYLDWAKEAAAGKATTAIVLEFGLNDANARDWSGSATVTGAKVMHREGYRFRKEDKLVAPNGWEASSHRPMRAPPGKPGITKLEPVASVGVVLHLQEVQPDAKVTIALKDGEMAEAPLADVLAAKTHSLWKGAATVRLITTAQAVADSPTEDDFPAAAYAPDGTLWVAYVSYHVLEEERRIEPPKLPEQPVDFKKYYTPGGRDQVMLRACRNGTWEKPIELTDANQEINRVAIGVTGSGGFWVVYSARRANDPYRIYARPLDARGRFGDELQLSSQGPDLNPVMCTEADGGVWLAYQTWGVTNSPGEPTIYMLRFRDGRWQDAHYLAPTSWRCWHPAIAAGPGWRLGIVCDKYTHYQQYYPASYDVFAIRTDSRVGAPSNPWMGAAPPLYRVATTAKFEARPSAVYDKTGRLWIAFEEGPENWGKDYGALDSTAGKPLYNERSIKVVCYEPDGKTMTQPVAELPVSKYDPPALPFEAVKTNQYERTTRYAYPQLGLDGNGNVWLAYRQNFGSRYSSHPGPYWLTYVRRLDVDRWSEPIEVHHSDGLLDHRPVLLPHASGGLLVIHNTDGRYTTPEVINNQIYSSVVNLPATSAPSKLVAHTPGEYPLTPEIKAEFDAVARMRKSSFTAGGKTYQYKRGEYHRHTEMSWDGAPDGSLEDMFRYAIDAVKFDWIGNGDHDNGAGREYSWWLTQKLTDAYAVPKHFTPMFTYERSVGYPHGHRNVMFAQRGIRTLPRLAAPKGDKGVAGVHPDDTKMLYRYLKELNGICAVHTSATGMGTDWRDNDPVVEPIVEIYQGDRMSYEYQGAPRAGYDPKGGMEPANVGGWQPLGFVNLALKEKGYKLGFQASSDHWSTHISFFTVLVEDKPRKSVQEDRQALLDAVKKRHCYGATDNILVDFRCGEAIMGDEVTVQGAPQFSINVVGTAPLQKIELLRDSEVITGVPVPVGKAPPTSFKGTLDDPQPKDGTHYYYLRVLQTDGEIAWASPIWVTRK